MAPNSYVSIPFPKYSSKASEISNEVQINGLCQRKCKKLKYCLHKCRTISEPHALVQVVRFLLLETTPNPCHLSSKLWLRFYAKIRENLLQIENLSQLLSTENFQHSPNSTALMHRHGQLRYKYVVMSSQNS